MDQFGWIQLSLFDRVLPDLRYDGVSWFFSCIFPGEGERRLQRSDSKIVITLSYTTSNLLLVALLLASSIIPTSFAFRFNRSSQAFRILYKTYMKSKAKERTFKVLLTKRANQVALHAIICWLPIFVLSVVKRVSPRTLLMDPKANPVFFVVILLAGNSEWWCYSLLMNGILGPVLKGIHSLEDKSSIDFVVSIRRLNKNIPVADLIVRVCLAIAALVGAVLDNQNNSTVLSLFFFQCYEHFKYMLFPLLWIRSLLLASSIVSNMTDRSSRTGGAERGAKQRASNAHL